MSCTASYWTVSAKSTALIAAKIGDDADVWADLEAHQGFVYGQPLRRTWKIRGPRTRDATSTTHGLL